MLHRPQPFCPSLSISQTIWQPSVCAMFALRAQDFSSFAVVVTSILEPGSQRSEAQITGTHHCYPLRHSLLIRNFTAPNAGAGQYIIMRPLSRTFATSVICRLATLPDITGLALWPRTWAGSRISHLRAEGPSTRHAIR